MSRGRESHESHAMRLAKSPMASAFYRPSRESHPNSSKKFRAGQSLGAENPASGEPKACSSASRASSCTAHTAPARAENLFGAMAAPNGQQIRRVIHGPLPGMSPCAGCYPQPCPRPRSRSFRKLALWQDGLWRNRACRSHCVIPSVARVWIHN